jgi:hypothetical protein
VPIAARAAFADLTAASATRREGKSGVGRAVYMGVLLGQAPLPASEPKPLGLDPRVGCGDLRHLSEETCQSFAVPASGQTPLL